MVQGSGFRVNDCKTQGIPSTRDDAVLHSGSMTARLFSGSELKLRKRFIQPVIIGDELVMCTLLHDFAIIKYNNSIGIADGRQPVSYDKGSTAMHKREVRPCISLSRASWTSLSDSESREEVASSRIRIFGSLSTARAMAIR